jgi:hypothetical protein
MRTKNTFVSAFAAKPVREHEWGLSHGLSPPVPFINRGVSGEYRHHKWNPIYLGLTPQEYSTIFSAWPTIHGQITDRDRILDRDGYGTHVDVTPIDIRQLPHGDKLTWKRGTPPWISHPSYPLSPEQADLVTRAMPFTGRVDNLLEKSNYLAPAMNERGTGNF